MIKTRTWVVIVVVLFAVCAAFSAVLYFSGSSGTVANVYLDGVCVRSIDLSKVEEPYSFEVASDKGVNVVKVEKGRICVSNADCPDKVCVRTGWLADSSMPIVCLPHRLVIRIEKNESESDVPDAVSG